MTIAPQGVLPDELRRSPPDIETVETGRVLWRVHFTTTRHPVAWNELRAFGPLPSARWDPHPLPSGAASGEGVAYLAFDVPTCLAEVFQETRTVDVDRGTPYATAMRLTRDIRLVDLRTPWFLRVGASAATALGPKDVTRAWARAIRVAWPDVDGIVAPSAVIGAHECVALWRPGETALPRRPLTSDPLASPALATRIAAASELIGFATTARFSLT